MRVIAKWALREFWESKPQYSDSEDPLSAWYSVCLQARWQGTSEVEETFRSASSVKNNVVFNIAGNTSRVVVNIDYGRQAMFIKFVGTHKQHDVADAGSIR